MLKKILLREKLVQKITRYAFIITENCVLFRHKNNLLNKYGFQTKRKISQFVKSVYNSKHIK